jgi:hypothetical protein
MFILNLLRIKCVSGTEVHSWEFCDQSDQHLVVTAIRNVNCSGATVIGTGMALQLRATVGYCIMLVLLQTVLCHSQIYDNIVSFETFTIGFAQICSNARLATAYDDIKKCAVTKAFYMMRTSCC